MGRLLAASILIYSSGLGAASAAEPVFAVASIKPSAAEVKFEHDGKTEVFPGAVTMRDVTVATCIKWAYEVQDSQISGPGWLQSDHFDVMARADEPVAVEQLKLMMRTLLTDRFKFSFHRQDKELRSFLMTIAKGGHKLHESAPGETQSRQNSAIGTIVKAMTMGEFANFIAGPLQLPVVDMTGLTGKYDFALDFTPYLPANERVMKMEFAEANGIIAAAMQGELGLKLESKKEMVNVMVVDHVEKPSEN
jgi:uncharacterized protein (TIGR03435 family)